MQLGFAKAHHQIPLKEKSWCGPGLGELLKISVFPFNIFATAEASAFKFGTQLGFAKANHKTTPEKKWAWSCIRKAPIYLWFPLIFLQRPRCPLSVSGASCSFTSIQNSQ